MNDICDHCGKPIKHPVHLEYQGHDLKYGPKCAKIIKEGISRGIKPMIWDKPQGQVNHPNA